MAIFACNNRNFQRVSLSPCSAGRRLDCLYFMVAPEARTNRKACKSLHIYDVTTSIQVFLLKSGIDSHPELFYMGATAYVASSLQEKCLMTLVRPASRASAPSAIDHPKVGPLRELPGTWIGTGFNLIARPDLQNQKPLFLEISGTLEDLEFHLIGGGIPNCGSEQFDASASS
jgi:hypothetical protein